MLVARCLEGLEGVAIADHGESGVFGVESESTSTVSTWTTSAFGVDSEDRMEVCVDLLSRYLRTSTRLLKYSSKQSSNVMVLLSSGISDGTATSSSRSVMNL
jgi:hypothetical protein